MYEESTFGPLDSPQVNRTGPGGDQVMMPAKANRKSADTEQTDASRYRPTVLTEPRQPAIPGDHPVEPREPLTSGYQFIYDVIGDQERLNGLVQLILVAAFAVTVLLDAATGLASILLRSDPVTVKFGITTASTALAPLGYFVVRFVVRRLTQRRSHRGKASQSGPGQPGPRASLREVQDFDGPVA